MSTFAMAPLDVSVYAGKIYLQFHLELRSGDVRAGFVTTPSVWSVIQQGVGGAEFRIGASSVGFVAYMWNPVVTEDPHEIDKLVHTHGDLMPEWIVEYLSRALSTDCTLCRT